MGWKGTAYSDKSGNNSHFSLLKHVSFSCYMPLPGSSPARAVIHDQEQQSSNTQGRFLFIDDYACAEGRSMQKIYSMVLEKFIVL